MQIRDLKVGDRVRLSAFDDGTVKAPEQDATVLELSAAWPGMLIVQIDVPDDVYDDCIRELDCEQVIAKL